MIQLNALKLVILDCKESQQLDRESPSLWHAM